MSNDTNIPAYNQEDVRYCETHESHWIPFQGASEKGASCPWCQRDNYWDELEAIYDVFLSAVRARESKGGQHVPYHGDFCAATQLPSTLREMKWWIERWGVLLGRNVRRGS